MQDAPGSELFTVLNVLDVALGMMAAISEEEVIFSNTSSGRCDSTRSERRDGHRVSTQVFPPSMGPVENMNKELCGLVRCFRIYLREKSEDGDHD